MAQIKLGMKLQTPDGTIMTVTKSEIFVMADGKVLPCWALIQTDPEPKYGRGDWAAAQLLPMLIDTGALKVVDDAV